MARAWWRMAVGRFDVVHAVEEAAHLAAPVARLLGLPLVVDVDSSIPDQLRESGFAARGPLLWAAEALEGHALRHSAAVVTVCASLTEGVRGRVPHGRVFQVEDPPLARRRRVRPPTSPRSRRRSASTIGPVVLYSGNFEPYQGVELLVDAAAARAGGPVRLHGRRAGPDRADAGPRRPRRGVRLRRQAADQRAARLPRRGRGAWSRRASPAPTRPSRSTRTSPRAGRWSPRASSPTPSCSTTPWPGWWSRRRPASPRASGPCSPIPAEARRRAARGLALIAREYSEARHAEKVAAAYAAIEATIHRSRLSSSARMALGGRYTRRMAAAPDRRQPHPRGRRQRRLRRDPRRAPEDLGPRRRASPTTGPARWPPPATIAPR